MNKQELSKSVYFKTDGLTQQQAQAAVNAVLDSIKETLEQGGEVNLAGFGSFKTKKTKPRTGRNPRTGESVQIPAKTAVVFKVGKGLKEAVN